MMKAKWYSPQLARELVRRLYFKAKAEGVPMTVLVNRLIENALGDTESGEEEKCHAVKSDAALD
ncbi:MAG TPA: hypothetical protein VNW72_04275 [Chthoniobacterales bacterium]|jgi:hypothetical protein|nr:hypothetical protein [Chthoniobacterales bacterium]